LLQEKCFVVATRRHHLRSPKVRAFQEDRDRFRKGHDLGLHFSPK
jgi:hypothetical protein